MKKRDIIIIVVLLVVAAGVYLGVTLLGGQNNAVTGYVSVTVNNREWVRLPLDEPTDYVVHQTDGDENTVTIEEGGVVYVSHSNCSNQDCVSQGKVTPDDPGVLMTNQIICLPHNVIIEVVYDSQQ